MSTVDRIAARVEAATANGNGSRAGDGNIVDVGESFPEPIDWPVFWALNDTSEDAAWLIEPILPVGRQVAAYSVPKAGKSLLFLECAAGLATGRAVLDRPAGLPVDVIYIDMEMTEDDLHERLTDLGYGPDDDLSLLHYYLLCNLPSLDTAAGGDAVMGLVARHRAVLLVLDTMARVVRGDENEADTYRHFYRHTGRRLKEAGVTLARLDHAGHDPSHQRGSSAKADDVDVVLRLSVDGDQVTLKATHSRVPWVPELVKLRRGGEPFRHCIVPADTWPHGTSECAGLLDQHEVSMDATVRTAQSALRAAGVPRRQDLVRSALKFRRTVP